MRSAADLDAALAPGRLGLMLSLEGMEPLGYDPALIDVFCALGVRMASLTWNRRNPFADGVARGARGRPQPDRPRRSSTAWPGSRSPSTSRTPSEGTFFEVLERTGDRPVLASHALCRAARATSPATSATTSCARWPSATAWSG